MSSYEAHPTLEIPRLFQANGALTETAIRLCELRKEVFLDEFVSAGVPQEAVEEHIAGWDPESFAEAMQPTIKDPEKFYVRAAMLGGRAVGYCSAGIVREEDGEYKELRAIQVAKGSRGKGLGKRMIDDFAAHDFSEDDGELPIKLTVLLGNERAQKFYRREGFVLEPGAEPEPFDIAGVSVPVLGMIRYVSSGRDRFL